MTKGQHTYDKRTTQIWQMDKTNMTEEQHKYDERTKQIWQKNNTNMTKDKHKYDKRTTQMFNTIQKFNNNEQKIFDVKKPRAIYKKSIILNKGWKEKGWVTKKRQSGH